ncbi:MAG TPA: sigma-70 family RNA polymerase sigma factor, partial [Thermomicrobiales bacterium]|nr:sigma-70 family RNA polymerase sigma factor [Thermomicrobiales bacterium]
MSDAPDVSGRRALAAARKSEAAVDAALMARVRAGDQAALSDLYDRHGRMVYAIALRLLRDASRAEDLTHDVFLVIWEHPERYRPEVGPFSPWFYRVARNRGIDVLRRLRRESQPGDHHVFEMLLQDPDPDPSEQASVRMESRRARAALEALPESQRAVIELAYFTGMTQREMAELLNEPLGTIKTRVRTGLRRMREILQAE